MRLSVDIDMNMYERLRAQTVFNKSTITDEVVTALDKHLKDVIVTRDGDTKLVIQVVEDKNR